jgi:hypothetical protein
VSDPHKPLYEVRSLRDGYGGGLNIRRNCPTHGPSVHAGGAHRQVRGVGRVWVCARCIAAELPK